MMKGVFKKFGMLPLLVAMSMAPNEFIFGSAFLLDTNCWNRRTQSFSSHLNNKQPNSQDVRDDSSTGGESNDISSSDALKNTYKNRPIPQRRFRSEVSAKAALS